MEDRTCPHCKRLFDYPSRLRQHLAKKTPCTAPRPEALRCDGCGKEFINPVSFARHQRHSCAALVYAPQAPLAPAPAPAPAHQRAQQIAPAAARPDAGPPPTIVHNHFEGICNFTVEGGGVIAGPGATVVSAGAGSSVVSAGAGSAVAVAVGGGAAAVAAPAAVDCGRGLPGKLRAPARPPRSITQPVRVTLAQLQQAISDLGVGVAVSVCSMDKAAVAALVLKLVTTQQCRDERWRNVLLNPDREDQVVVWTNSAAADSDAPDDAEGCWDTMPLVAAVRLLFDQFVRGLSRVTGGTPRDAEVTRCTRAAYARDPDRIAEGVARPAAAHFRKMAAATDQARAAIGLGLPPEIGVNDPMTLGHETGSYLDHTTLARIVRARCGAGATPEAAWELLTLVAEQVYSRTAPNATVHPLDDGRVVAFTSFGWKEIPRAGAEARVLRILVELLQEANEVGYVDPDDLEALRKRPVASDFIGGLADALPLEGPRGRGALLDRVGAWTRYVATHTRSSHYYEELRDRWLTPRRADEIVPGFLAGR